MFVIVSLFMAVFLSLVPSLFRYFCIYLCSVKPGCISLCYFLGSFCLYFFIYVWCRSLLVVMYSLYVFISLALSLCIVCSVLSFCRSCFFTQVFSLVCLSFFMCVRSIVFSLFVLSVPLFSLFLSLSLSPSLSLFLSFLPYVFICFSLSFVLSFVISFVRYLFISVVISFCFFRDFSMYVFRYVCSYFVCYVVLSFCMSFFIC